VVIDNLDIDSALGCPPEAHAPLIVDADAVFTLPVALKTFKPS
jgi:hypothetical protein